MSINHVAISGNLTRDPELKVSQGGTHILNFGVAVNDRVKNQQTGEWEDYANFVDCVIFGNRAESLSRILHKGMRVMLDGRLHYSSWEKDGGKRSKIEVIVNDVDLLPRNQQGPALGQQRQQQYQQAPQQPMQQAPMQQTPQYQQQAAPQYQPAPQQQAPQQGGYYDEDIPF